MYTSRQRFQDHGNTNALTLTKIVNIKKLMNIQWKLNRQIKNRKARGQKQLNFCSFKFEHQSVKDL